MMLALVDNCKESSQLPEDRSDNRFLAKSGRNQHLEIPNCRAGKDD
jgi:hypothetical protein